jgi:ABC-type Zn uptake system ZnuABC Zn-binding protein ZnuA
LGLSVGLLGLLGCRNSPSVWDGKPGKHVLTSFAPLSCFAQNVAGDDATVMCVMTNRGPHGFDPGPSDALMLQGADIFFINGLDLDEKISERLKEGAGNPKLKIVECAEAIPESRLRHDGDADSHGHGRLDPHVWLGIPEAIIMVEKIRDELKDIDAPHAAGYESRANEYIERLKNLQNEGVAALKNKKDRKLVTFHDSLFYFARTFNLELVDSIEISPGTEPSKAKMGRVVEACEKNNVRLITVEPQYPMNSSARTILTELKSKGINAEFVEIDPLETARPEDSRPEDLTRDFFENRMRQNLQQLEKKMR